MLEGSNGKVEDDVSFRTPDGPRLYRLDPHHLFVYGYAPNELIRLFQYTKEGEFAGWQEFEVDSNGMLSIKISVDTHPYLTYFFVIGEQSGEARLLQEDYFGKTVDRTLQKSIQIAHCSVLDSRLSIGDKGRVAFTDGAQMRMRRYPSLQSEILYKVPEGTSFTVTDGPKCDNDIIWWEVHTTDGLAGWMAEFDDEVYLLEPYP